MATTLVTNRQRLISDLGLGLVIPNADFTAAAATSITAANTLRNTNWSPTHFSDKGTGIFRPTAATSADYFRFAGDLAPSTGVLSHNGANYADTTTTSEIPELLYWNVRPDRHLIDALNRISEFGLASSQHLFSHGSRLDYAMDLNALDTNLTDVGTPTTSAKTTTQSADVVPYGPRAYRVVCDAANEGTRSAGLRVAQGRNLTAFAIVAAESGTASFQILDATNVAYVGTAVTHSERRPMLMCIRNQELPATCKAIQLDVLGTVNPSDLYINMLGAYVLDDLLLQLPGFITESFMAPRFYQMIPRVQIATDVYDATSLEPRPLIEGVDYWPVYNHYDAEPYKVRFRSAALFEWPIFVDYKRPVSDFTTFAADDTATTALPQHELLPRWKIEVLDSVYNDNVAPKLPDWDNQMRKAREQLAVALASRPHKSMTNAKRYYAGVSRM